MNKTIIIGLITLLLGCTQQAITINSFEDCANAGYPVMESYPRQCRTPDGRNFVEEIIIEANNTGIETNNTNTQANDTVTNHQIIIRNFQFEPNNLVIKLGDTVTWTNQDSLNHIVASNPHPVHTDLPGFESGTLRPGDSYTYTFNKEGAWSYHCHLHSTMTGTVTVN